MTLMHREADAGFILLDALIAATIAALAVVATLRLVVPMVDRRSDDTFQDELLQSVRAAIVQIRTGLDLPESTSRHQFSRRDREAEEGLYVTVFATASWRGGQRTASLTTLLPRVRYAPPR